MKTTTNKQELADLGACHDVFDVFVKAHGDNIVTFSQAFQSNGWDDIWWLLEEVWDQLSKEQKNDLQLLGCDWAESVLHIFEEQYPNDDRPRKAIQAKRDFLEGLISEESLNDYRSAALDAAWAAAIATARDTVRSAARDAARAAAIVTARDTAGDNVRSAAWAAARGAAIATARAAAWAAAGPAAVEKFEKDLMDLFLEWEQ